MREWRRGSRFVPLPIILALSGCTYLQAQSRVDPQTVASYAQLRSKNGANSKSCILPKIGGDSREGAIDLDCLYFPEKLVVEDNKIVPEQSSDRILAYAAAQLNPADRNRLAAILIKQSDDVCTLEMGRLTANEAIANAGLSIAGNALSTASAIVSGNLAKSILAGGASFSNATRGHINAEVYRNALSTAVSRAIMNERTRLALEIKSNRSKGVEEYSVDEMIVDVNRYHQTCSFFRGLELVVQAVERTTPTLAARYEGLTTGINDLNEQIALIDANVASGRLSEESKKSLSGSRNTLANKLTELITQRADALASQTEVAPKGNSIPIPTEIQKSAQSPTKKIRTPKSP